MSKLTIAYTVSSSYSGSTLLSMLLNTQPDIGTISEFDAQGDIPHDPEFKCSCGSEIRSCQFFSRVEAAMGDSGFDFQVENINEILRVHDNSLMDRLLVGSLPYLRSSTLEALRDRLALVVPWHRRRLSTFYDKNESFMRAILQQQNAHVFLDANKDSYRMLLLARRFDVRPVFIYKNGIAGVYSYVKNAIARGKTRTVEEASVRWFKEQLEILRLLNRFDGNFFQLSYSDLCRDVGGTLQRIAKFLGTRFENVPDLTACEHHIIGNRMRMRTLTEVREDEKWKSNMSEADIEVYRRVYKEFAPLVKRLNEAVFNDIWH